MKIPLQGSLGWALAAAWALGQGPGVPPSAVSESPSPKAFAIERFTWGKEVDGPAPIRAVEIHNDYGDVRARLTQDRRLESSGVIQRLGRGPEGVGVTVERRGALVVLTVAYPPGRVQDADPDPPKDGMDRFDMTVFVPAGVALGARTLRGMVEVRGLKSDVTAATLGGAIFVSTGGSVQAWSVEGTITAAVSGVGPRPLVFETISGAIEVTLPMIPDLEVRAETGGVLSSDFPLKRRRAGGRDRAMGTLGRPVRDLLATSVSGAITLRRGR